jgi:tRNA threonylcarbamoyladenosine biosynthesis protein TsaE
MDKRFFSNSEEETKRFGEKLAKEVLKKGPGERAVVFGLVGELGAGKTTFIKGFGKGLGVKEEITSPSYVLLKRFKIRKGFKNFYHLDCWRLEKGRELLDLGFSDIYSSGKNVVVVEWAGKVRKIMPEDTSYIRFQMAGEEKRKIIFEG